MYGQEEALVAQLTTTDAMEPLQTNIVTNESEPYALADVIEPLAGKTVALLDVDHTLLFDDTLNQSLLNVLKPQGITDVYLFTDMTLSNFNIEDRNKLVEKLKAQGFTVHGVVSSADYAWHLDDEVLRSFSKDLDAISVKFDSDEGKKKLKEIIEKYPQIQEYLAGNLTDQGRAGVAYGAVKDQLFSHEIQKRSEACKLLLDIMRNHRSDEPDIKGLLFEQLLKGMPSDVEGYILVDDKKENLDALQKANNPEGQPPRVKLGLVNAVDNKTKARSEGEYRQEIARCLGKTEKIETEFEQLMKDIATLSQDEKKKKIHSFCASHEKEIQGYRKSLDDSNESVMHNFLKAHSIEDNNLSNDFISYNWTIELKEYYEALKQSFQNANENPERCIYCFNDLCHAIESLGLDPEKYISTLELEKFDGQNMNLLNVKQFNENIIAYRKHSSEESQFISAFCSRVGELRFGNVTFPNVANNQEDKKAKKFVKKEKSFNKLQKLEDPFKLIGSDKKFHLSARILGRYDQTRNLPIDLVVRYIIQHPHTAHDFLKKRFLFGRDFRGELYKNPELIDMLIRSGNKTILDAIGNTSLLESGRLGEDQKKRLGDQLNKQSPAPVASTEHVDTQAAHVGVSSSSVQGEDQQANSVKKAEAEAEAKKPKKPKGPISRAASAPLLRTFTQSSLARDIKLARAESEKSISEFLMDPKEAVKTFNQVLQKIGDPENEKIKNAVISHANSGNQDAKRALAEAYVRLQSSNKDHADFRKWFDEGLEDPEIVISLLKLKNEIRVDDETNRVLMRAVSEFVGDKNIDVIAALAEYYRPMPAYEYKAKYDELIDQLANVYFNLDKDTLDNSEKNKWEKIQLSFPTIMINIAMLERSQKNTEVERIVKKNKDSITKDDLTQLFELAGSAVLGAGSFIFENPDLIEKHQLQDRFYQYFDSQRGGEDSQQAFLLKEYPDNSLLQSHWRSLEAIRAMESLSDEEQDAAIEESLREVESDDQFYIGIPEVMPVLLPVGGYEKLLTHDPTIVSDLIQNLSNWQKEMEKNDNLNDASAIQKNIDTIVCDLQGFANAGSFEASMALHNYYRNSDESLSGQWYENAEKILKKAMQDFSQEERRINLKECKEVLGQISMPFYREVLLSALNNKVNGDPAWVPPSGEEMKAFVSEVNQKLQNEGITRDGHQQLIEKHALQFLSVKNPDAIFTKEGLKLKPKLESQPEVKVQLTNDKKDGLPPRSSL